MEVGGAGGGDEGGTLQKIGPVQDIHEVLSLELRVRDNIESYGMKTGPSVEYAHTNQDAPSVLVPPKRVIEHGNMWYH